MNGKVKAIVLSPAPAEEETPQDGRKLDQELWRQVSREEKNPQKTQVFKIDEKNEDEEKEKETAGKGLDNDDGGRGGECDSKRNDIETKEDKNGREGRQKGADREKATEETAKGEC